MTTHAVQHFGLAGTIIAKPGRRDALVDLLLRAARLVGGLEGCRLYAVALVDGEPDAVWVSEIWASAEDHSASLQRDDVRSLISEGMPLIDSLGESTRLTIVGGHGIAEPSG